MMVNCWLDELAVKKPRVYCPNEPAPVEGLLKFTVVVLPPPLRFSERPMQQLRELSPRTASHTDGR